MTLNDREPIITGDTSLRTLLHHGPDLIRELWPWLLAGSVAVAVLSAGLIAVVLMVARWPQHDDNSDGDAGQVVPMARSRRRTRPHHTGAVHPAVGEGVTTVEIRQGAGR